MVSQLPSLIDVIWMLITTWEWQSVLRFWICASSPQVWEFLTHLPSQISPWLWPIPSPFCSQTWTMPSVIMRFRKAIPYLVFLCPPAAWVPHLALGGMFACCWGPCCPVISAWEEQELCQTPSALITLPPWGKLIRTQKSLCHGKLRSDLREWIRSSEWGNMGVFKWAAWVQCTSKRNEHRVHT